MPLYYIVVFLLLGTSTLAWSPFGKIKVDTISKVGLDHETVSMLGNVLTFGEDVMSKAGVFGEKLDQNFKMMDSMFEKFLMQAESSREDFKTLTRETLEILAAVNGSWIDIAHLALKRVDLSLLVAEYLLDSMVSGGNNLIALAGMMQLTLLFLAVIVLKLSFARLVSLIGPLALLVSVTSFVIPLFYDCSALNSLNELSKLMGIFVLVILVLVSIIWIVHTIRIENSLLFLTTIALLIAIVCCLYTLQEVNRGNRKILMLELVIQNQSELIEQGKSQLDTFSNFLNEQGTSIQELIVFNKEMERIVSQPKRKLRYSATSSDGSELSIPSREERAFYMVQLQVQSRRPDGGGQKEIHCEIQKYMEGNWHSTVARIQNQAVKSGGKGHAWLYGNALSSMDVIEPGASMFRVHCENPNPWDITNKNMYIWEFFYE